LPQLADLTNKMQYRSADAAKKFIYRSLYPPQVDQKRDSFVCEEIDRHSKEIIELKKFFCGIRTFRVDNLPKKRSN
jgi:hypothetical protein